MTEVNGTITYSVLLNSNSTADLTAAVATNLINWNFFSSDKLVSWLSDLTTTWKILLASVGFALLISLIYLLFIRFCAGVIAYATILLILASLCGLGYLFQQRADYYTSVNDSTYHTTMLVLCGLCYSFAGIWLIVILFMCNRIRLAIALTKVTARYVGTTCSLYIIPLVFFIFHGLFYTYWVALSIYLYSTGEVQKDSSFIANIKWDSTTRYAWWYHLFSLFYINAFIDALNQFVLASCACIWYWEQANPDGPKRLISRSFWRAFRFHLGSLAFGSLIIAIIRFIIVIMEYFKRKVEAAGAPKAKFYKCLITCCQCCLACFARIMEFINKHAYIQIAIKGDSFCSAAWEGFALIVRNLGRWSMLFLLSTVFNFIGKLFIAACNGLIGYLLITRISMFSDKLNSPILPTTVLYFINF